MHRDELLQNEGLILGRTNPFHFFGFDAHVLIGRILKAVRDFRCFHGAMHGAAFLVLDALAAVGMKLIERGGASATVSGIGFDGNGDEAEPKQPRPTGPSTRPGGFVKTYGIRRRFNGANKTFRDGREHQNSPFLRCGKMKLQAEGQRQWR